MDCLAVNLPVKVDYTLLKEWRFDFIVQIMHSKPSTTEHKFVFKMLILSLGCVDISQLQQYVHVRQIHNKTQKKTQ